MSDNDDTQGSDAPTEVTPLTSPSEPTQSIPVTPPPYVPSGDGQPTNPSSTGAAPPVGNQPPLGGLPPGTWPVPPDGGQQAPYQPPGHQAQQYQPPGYPTTEVRQVPPGMAPVGPPPPAGGKKSRVGLVLALLVLSVLLIGGAAFAVLGLTGSSDDAGVSMDSCVINADGSLRATGGVSGPNGTGATVKVEFADSVTGKVIDTAETSIDISFGGIGGDRWQVEGTAGAEVRRIVCKATARI